MESDYELISNSDISFQSIEEDDIELDSVVCFFACINADKGCKVQCVPLFFPDHLRTCIFGYSKCILCEASVQRKDLHLHMNSHLNSSLSLQSNSNGFKEDKSKRSLLPCIIQDSKKVTWGTSAEIAKKPAYIGNRYLKAISFSGCEGWSASIKINVRSIFADNLAIIDDVEVSDSVWNIKKKIVQKAGLKTLDFKSVQLSINGIKMRDENLITDYPEIVDGCGLDIHLITPGGCCSINPVN